MELDPRSSMYVAPLQIGKDEPRAMSRGSDRPGTSSSAYYSASTQQQTGQATPPLTPLDPQATFQRDEEFSPYLRASYSYHPSSDQGSSTVTLPLNVGDVILVHSIHTNGWADGTLLASGARGWLPTNYCERYRNEPMRSLLKALTAFWDLAKGSSNRVSETFRNSEFVRGLVAGVRCLLEKTSCLTRESPLVQTHHAIHKHRKSLLSDLSAFVKMTKVLEANFENTGRQERVDIDLDGMIMKAFRIIIRAVNFYDVWDDHMQGVGVSPWHAEIPPTPPADRTNFATAEAEDSLSAGTRHSAATATTADARKSNEHGDLRLGSSCGSKSCIRPGSSNSCRQSDRSSSRQAPRAFAAHRVSCNVHPGSQNLASEKLGALHNGFLTYLGYFIGLHMQSRASSEILITTRHSVLACRDMLELVEDVWERDRKRSRALKDARDNMHRKIGDLAEAAQYVFRPLRSEEEDLLLPSEGQPLIDAATACVRAAGECVAESRFIIDRIGDYAFEPLGLGIDNLSSSNFPHQSVDSQQEGSSQMEKPSDPPRPSSSPPPPPPDKPTLRLPSGMLHTPLAQDSRSMDVTSDASTPQASSTRLLLPPLPPFAGSLLSQDDHCTSPVVSISSSGDARRSIDSGRDRTDSLGVSSTGNSSTYIGSLRDSETSALSQTSTRATSPDAKYTNSLENLSVEQASLATDHPNSSGSSQRTCGEDFMHSSRTLSEDIEENILEQTFAHELVHNKDGQITGGTLPALIERLTTPDSTPDATFVSTFYLTFRLFASPIEFAQALIDRFNYVGESPRVASPVRLRVYNVFKGWLESHWRNDCDTSALDLITTFATRQLQLVLPTAGKRLATLAIKVTSANGPLVPRLISSMGKTNTSIAQYISPNAPIPPSIITKNQLGALKNWKNGGASISVLDFGPLELARQLTIKESQIFCSILPEELLASEWTKRSGSMAVNVREMSRLSNDISNLVAESILEVEDSKKRAVIVKQWIKIADKLLELSNYHSLMAIVCSLTQSTIQRLKRTWEQVSNKTKSTLERLRGIINHERNHASLRQIFQNQVPPCIPWVGLYLTDLTFVDAGNQTTRQLTGDRPEDSKSVINFDKHMKTAKIISELQRFQVPYRLQEVPELQTWMQDQLVRVRTNDQTFVVKDYYRRSLLLEPREQAKASPEEPQTSQFSLFKSKEKTATQSSSHHNMLPIH